MSDIQFDTFTETVMELLEDYSGTTAGRMLEKAYSDRDYEQCNHLIKQIRQLEAEGEYSNASI